MIDASAGAAASATGPSARASHGSNSSRRCRHPQEEVAREPSCSKRCIRRGSTECRPCSGSTRQSPRGRRPPRPAPSARERSLRGRRRSRQGVGLLLRLQLTLASTLTAKPPATPTTYSMKRTGGIEFFFCLVSFGHSKHLLELWLLIFVAKLCPTHIRRCWPRAW